MHIYEVGKLYHPGRTSWPETATYSFRGGQHELLLFYERPTEREIEDVRKGQADFALYVKDPVIALCWRFSVGDWSDAPYSWHLVPEAERILPQDLKGETERILLHVILVGAHDGRIKTMRAVTFTPGFSHALHVAIREQANSPWEQAAYDLALTNLYGSLSSTDLVSLATARCRGGDQ
jgi:hypothetical protein